MSLPPAFLRDGYAAWLVPSGDSKASLDKVIQVLSTHGDPDSDILGTAVFPAHLTLLAPMGKAGRDLDVFTGALERAVAALRKQLGAKPGKAVNIHMMLDWPAAGMGWYDCVFAPVTDTTGGRAVMDFRKLLAKECGEPPQTYGWFPFTPDGEWFPHFALAYANPNSEVGLLSQEGMWLRADMVVLAKATAKFPMATACSEVVIVNIKGEVKDWQIVASMPL